LENGPIFPLEDETGSENRARNAVAPRERLRGDFQRLEDIRKANQEYAKGEIKRFAHKARHEEGFRRYEKRRQDDSDCRFVGVRALCLFFLRERSVVDHTSK
jgi:hypothetical protein